MAAVLIAQLQHSMPDAPPRTEEAWKQREHPTYITHPSLQGIFLFFFVCVYAMLILSEHIG